MGSRNEIVAEIRNLGMVAVVRTNRPAQIIPLCEALVAGGVRALELTMTIPDAVVALEGTVKHFGSRALIGMGSILNATMAKAAVAGGAEFLVTPITRPEVIAVAHAADRPVMMGAYSPTEAQLAHESGADFVKIFPAETLGTAYIKALRAPMPHLQIVPTGGVTAANVGEFFKAGCVAVGVGSSLLDGELIRTENWTGLTKRAKEFVTAVQRGR